MLKVAGKSNSIIAVISRFANGVQLWKRNYLLLTRKRKEDVVIARLQIDMLLSILECKRDRLALPWLASEVGSWRCEWLYAKRRRKSNRIGLTSSDSDILRWGIYSLQADVTFPCLFDLGEFRTSLPGLTCDGGRQKFDLTRPFSSSVDPHFKSLIARTQRLQTRWVGMTFLFPEKASTQFFDSVFGFTSHLLKFQLMLAAVAQAFEDGSAFDQDQFLHLQRTLDGQVTTAVAEKASFADLLHLHFAVLRLWGVLHGQKELDDMEFVASLQTSSLASYDASGVALQVFIPLLRENPLSVLMLNGVLCDIDIFSNANLSKSSTQGMVSESQSGDEADGHDELEIPVKLACLFNQLLADDLVSMLADYCHLGMNLPFILDSTVFGEQSEIPYVEYLNRRLQFVAQYIDTGFEQSNGPARRRIVMFGARFFEALLHDWMMPVTHQKAERILPGVEVTALPRMIGLAVIRLGKPSAKVKALLYRIVGKLHEGHSFADLARIHSMDKVSAAIGGNLGTMMLGEIDSAIEAGVFLSGNEENLFSVETDSSIYLVQVEGREYGTRPKVLEWLVRYAVVESVNLRFGLFAMLGTLQRLIHEEAVLEHADDDLLRLVTLAKECLKMQPLLNFDYSRLEPQ